MIKLKFLREHRERVSAISTRIYDAGRIVGPSDQPALFTETRIAELVDAGVVEIVDVPPQPGQLTAEQTEVLARAADDILAASAVVSSRFQEVNDALNLNGLTVAELRDIAAAVGLDGAAAMRKAPLVQALEARRADVVAMIVEAEQ